jgi:hypothetical protein
MSERNLATVHRFWDANPFTEGIDIYRHAQDGRIEEMWGYFQA